MGVVFEREYGVATQFVAPILKLDNQFAASTDWTPAPGQIKVVKDGGFPANIETLPAIVSGSKLWRFPLSAAETAAKEVLIHVDSGGVVLDDAFLISTYGDDLAEHAANRNVPLLAEMDLRRVTGVLYITTIASVVDATTVTLPDGPSEDDYLSKANVIVSDPGTAGLYGYSSVSDYVGATRTVSLAEALPFAPAVGSTISFAAPGLCGQISDMATATEQANLLQAINDLHNLDSAAFRAELLQVLDADAYSELSAVPPANASITQMLRWLYMLARNRKQQGEQVQSLYADDNTTIIAERDASDVANVLTLTKFE